MWILKKKQPSKEVTQAGSPPCRLARKSLFKEAGFGSTQSRIIDLDAHWIRQHIATCKRCQQRFAAAGRVNLAFQLARSRAQAPDLLARANQKALRMMSQATRESTPAEYLRVVFPEPSVWDHLRLFRGSLTQMAACIAIMTLGKIGFLSSLHNTQARTQNAMRTYYAERIGESMAEEVFPG